MGVHVGGSGGGLEVGPSAGREGTAGGAAAKAGTLDVGDAV